MCIYLIIWPTKQKGIRMTLKNYNTNEIITVEAWLAYNLDTIHIGWYSWQENKQLLLRDRATFYPAHAWREVPKGEEER